MTSLGQHRIWGLGKRVSAFALALAAVFTLGVVANPAAQAQTYNVLHSFSHGEDGSNPFAGLTMDRAGNLYGTASLGGSENCYFGGDYGCGTVFKLSHKGSGWVFNTLYSFTGGNDGWTPYTRVIFGPDGNLYGATYFGGGTGGPFGTGFGTIFKLQPPATACKSALCSWTETQIYIFTGGVDGGAPITGDLVFDQAGDFYGTSGATINSYGSVYRLSPSNGGWMFNVLYSFTGGSGGDSSNSGVVFDKDGNIWGTAGGGIWDCGQSGDPCGILFELVPSGSGWTENTVYKFHRTVGGGPSGNLIVDPSGNLYGTLGIDGPGGEGTVFEVTGGTFTDIHAFYGADGNDPPDSVVMDAAGNLYGTTFSGGSGSCNGGCGVVYKLAPSNGGWIYTKLHDFAGGTDGQNPAAKLIVDANSNLYGTTVYGGPPSKCIQGCGVVFEITP